LLPLSQIGDIRLWMKAKQHTAVIDGPPHTALPRAVGLAALSRGDAVVAEEAFREILSQNPADPAALHGLGKALHDQARLDEAEAIFCEAERLGADVPRARYHLGLLRLLRVDHDAGWKGWEERAAVLNFPSLPIPLWDGAPMPGQRLLVLGEQGFGDVIQFARFLPEAAQRSGAILTFGCAPPLLPLLATFCAAHGIRAISGQVSPGNFDAYVWLASLPHLLAAKKISTAAYLSADTKFSSLWHRRRPRRAHCIGICWEGRSSHPQDAQRSISPALLQPLYALPGIILVGLQLPPVQRPAPPHTLDMDWGPDISDFAVAAAMLSALDMLITVDTAMAHLAGALGVPALVLLPHVPDWRWGISGEASAWYGNLRLLRQQRPGDWSAPIAAAAAAITA
jgi:tetratricopeptide (TPR) repeat protein